MTDIKLTKLKAVTEDKIEKIKSVSGRIDDIVRKGENPTYQHFLNFPQCFLKPFFSSTLKVCIVWERVELVVFHAQRYI